MCGKVYSKYLLYRSHLWSRYSGRMYRTKSYSGYLNLPLTNRHVCLCHTQRIHLWKCVRVLMCGNALVWVATLVLASVPIWQNVLALSYVA